MALLPGPLLGVTAYPNADRQLLKDAGVAALRYGLPWPWIDRPWGQLNPKWDDTVAQLRSLAEDGFTIVGGTPIFGSLVRDRQDPAAEQPAAMSTRWVTRAPDWMGAVGSEAFNENYRQCCRFFGQELRGLVPMYQLLNELDLHLFAGPLNPRQACELVEAAAAGLRETDPDACLGINSAGTPNSFYLYGRLYRDDLLDYAGVDGYRGTWEAGGPADWEGLIRNLHAITRRPVFVNEWGYASVGELMSPQEAEGEVWPCEHKKWRFAWGDGHDPQTQAAYVQQAMQAFDACGDAFLGCLFYRWEDQPKCWQCGQPDCPAETAWGLVDRDNQPKPAWYAFKEGADAIRRSR